MIKAQVFGGLLGELSLNCLHGTAAGWSKQMLFWIVDMITSERVQYCSLTDLSGHFGH